MIQMIRRPIPQLFALLMFGGFLLFSPSGRAQESSETGPVDALTSALAGACKQNQGQFANYLTAENAVAYHALPEDERIALMKRIALADDPGKPLLSADAENHTILRCETPSVAVEFRLGAPRVHDNLAFIPVTVAEVSDTNFGMVREDGKWKVLSLGLVVLNIPDLSRQWAVEDLAAREGAAEKTLEGLAGAITTYQKAFGNLPESLAQLGPAPKEGISPEQANLVDEQLAMGKAGGYRFRYRVVPDEVGNNTGFELVATPEQYGTNGKRSFFRDVAGKIHAADKNGSPAAASDPLIASENEK